MGTGATSAATPVGYVGIASMSVRAGALARVRPPRDNLNTPRRISSNGYDKKGVRVVV
jgi:hypothetical protein